MAIYIRNEQGEIESCKVLALKGDVGVTPNIQIGEVTTLEPEQKAAVVIRGTKENPILDFAIPQGPKGESFKEEIKVTPVIDSTLNLTTDKHQLTHMENNTEIVLPTVDKYTEIHLFFSTTEELTLTLPNVKWQTEPTLDANKTYEFIFTYANEWLGGTVVYSG